MMQGEPGDTRAFDARTGVKLWEFHTVPRPGEAGHETWGDGWKDRCTPACEKRRRKHERATQQKQQPCPSCRDRENECKRQHCAEKFVFREIEWAFFFLQRDMQ